MAGKKCVVCQKTAYPMESLTASENTYHKLCFKCQQCKTSLSLKNYKRVGNEVFCMTHAPVDRASQGGDGFQVQAALKAPKRTTESLGVQKGTGEAPAQVADFKTAHALKAPKASAEGLGRVQKGTGEKPNYNIA